MYKYPIVAYTISRIDYLGGVIMHNEQQQPHYTESNHMGTEQKHASHSLLDAHETIGTVVASIEQSLLYENHIQDEQLMQIATKHRTYLQGLYNTIVQSMKSGQDPAVPTQTYNMSESTNVVYGMKPGAPKTPVASVQEINDECVSGFLLGSLKAISTEFTTTALESTNPVLRRIFADSIPNVIEMAYELFLYQNKHHYYQLPQLEPAEMEALQNSFAPVQGNITH